MGHFEGNIVLKAFCSARRFISARMDFIAAGEETARDFGQPPSLTSSEGFPVHVR